jgi:hypothetical protein
MATNMSIDNCKIPNSVLFLSENQPKKNEGYTYLNQQALDRKSVV